MEKTKNDHIDVNEIISKLEDYSQQEISSQVVPKPRWMQ